MATFERAAAPAHLGQGNEVKAITEPLIVAIPEAQREANGGQP
jgi:hypothetical protein